MKKQKLLMTSPDKINELITRYVEDLETNYFLEKILRKEKEVSEKKNTLNRRRTNEN